MKQFVRKLACLAMTGALALGGLAACNGGAGSSSKSYSSAKEVVEAFKSNPNSKNYHFDLDASLDVETSLLGTISGKLKVDSDMANDNSHSNIAYDILGGKVNDEEYTEKDGDSVTVYSGTNTGEGMAWTKSKENKYAYDIAYYLDTLSEGEFATNDAGYTITLTGEQTLKVLTDTLSGSGFTTDIVNSLDSSVKDAINKSKAVFTFDKEALLTNAEYNFEYSAPSSTSTDDLSQLLSLIGQLAKLKVSAKLAWNNYGNVDANSVKVPDNVKKDAVDTDQLAKDISDLVSSFTSEGGNAASTSTTQDAA